MILESLAPGYLPSQGLGYEELKGSNPGLVMCSLSDFGQTGPWRDYVSSDLLHLAAGGQMASCGYSDEDVPNPPPIAPGGGNAWHMGSHYAYMAIMAALVYRTSTGRGQYVDASVHDACALTTEGAMPVYIYRGKVVIRQTGRHHSETPPPLTQMLSKDGKWVSARIATELNPRTIRRVAEWMDTYGMTGDLMDERYRDPEVIRENASYIVDLVNRNLVGSLSQDELYHGAQERGIQWGAIRTPEDLVDDGHLEDRGFWKEVLHPELGRSFKYPGPPPYTTARPGASPGARRWLGSITRKYIARSWGFSGPIWRRCRNREWYRPWGHYTSTAITIRSIAEPEVAWVEQHINFDYCTAMKTEGKYAEGYPGTR